MRILILYNVATALKKGVQDDLICEQEITIIVPLVVELLSTRGHHVETLQTDYDLWEHLKARRGQLDIVLNMAEAFGGTNTNETLVPAMLEALDLPFTGASSHNMHLTLDKEKTKLVVKGYGIPVPAHQIFRSRTEKLESGLTFPLIVKPVREEASVGIHFNSVVTTRKSLYRKVAYTLQKYRQPAIVEEFIKGREISVGIIGNSPDLTVFPPLEFLFADADSELEQIRSYEYKWGGRKEQMVQANLSDDVIARLVEHTRTAYVATECRDYARMDYRLDDKGNIYLLEVNYNPGIGPNTHGLNNTLTMMASFTGMTFEDLVEQIIMIAAKRYGFPSSGTQTKRRRK
jgi:D-alanine-D-alanine ligase